MRALSATTVGFHGPAQCTFATAPNMLVCIRARTAALPCSALSALCMPSQAVKQLLQVSQSRDASLVEFPGAYHELFMGAERDASVKALRDWCEPACCARWQCTFLGHEHT